MVLICNAGAGGGGAGRALAEVRRHLDERELEHEIHFTERSGHATELARAALAEGTRFLVAVGGDGTVHEVVNGMIADDRAAHADAVFGVVAAGTGCDFIRTFGIPAMAGHAVAHLDGGDSFPIDIGKITFTRDGALDVRYFANIAEAGLGAEVAARADRLPRWFGPTTYVFALWLALARHRPTEAIVDLVDRKYEGALNNLIVANGQFYGGGMKIAPKAAPTDGILDFLIDRTSRREALALLPKVFKGEHLPHPQVTLSKRVRGSIETDHPLRIEADGELLGHTPATFELLPNALSLKV